ncbi:cysteine hydrolase family protein [Priestia megaterium]|uniref:cysteine hydrolase family protein n=1 Tax=Priestia megaterium TaxID=1404 RepID=UPI001865BA29|nr:cysteine hydrolase family protein [Priestia megaterium]MBE2978401.1 cysteine hydrolase [Priestia megaterium]
MSKKTALLLIDVQNIMFSYKGGSLWNEQQVLKNITSLREKAHQSNVPIIYIQHTDPSSDSMLSEGKVTWEIHQDVRPLPIDTVIQKSSWDAFYQTTLHEKLQELKIGKLVIAGMQTEFCLDTTCRRAYSLGYKENILVRDAHSTFDTAVLSASKIVEHHNNMLGGRFVTLKQVNEIIF